MFCAFPASNQTVYDRGVVRGPIDVIVCGERILAYEELRGVRKVLARVAYHVVHTPLASSLFFLAATKVYGNNLERVFYSPDSFPHGPARNRTAALAT